MGRGSRTTLGRHRGLEAVAAPHGHLYQGRLDRDPGRGDRDQPGDPRRDAGGVPASGQRAMDLAERHRQHISRWFYDCDYGMHRGLAELYLADQRFGKNYDDMAPGLAQYMHDAMLANAAHADA